MLFSQPVSARRTWWALTSGENMYETYTTVIGTVISQPRRRRTAAAEDVFSFRMACNSHRGDKRNGEWVEGPTLYLTVSCRRRLIDGVTRLSLSGVGR